MKKLFFALASFALLASACTFDNDVPPVKTFQLDEAFTLGWGESAMLEPGQLKITFLGITEDSRCPADVECIWEGRAVAQFEFAKGGEVVVDSLATLSSAATPSDATTVFGQTVKLLEVTPYPQTTAPIPHGDYQVKIVVN